MTLLTHPDPGGRSLGSAVDTITVPERFVGPPGMANGGWISGTVAGAIAARSVEVTLRAPTPIGRPLTLESDGFVARLLDGEQVLVEAQPALASPLPPSPVGFADAAIAETRFPAHDHPFPGCFVCGHHRAVGDGLRIFPGAVPGRPDTVASWWTPPADLAGPDGTLPEEVVWACARLPDRVGALLARCRRAPRPAHRRHPRTRASRSHLPRGGPALRQRAAQAVRPGGHLRRGPAPRRHQPRHVDLPDLSPSRGTVDADRPPARSAQLRTLMVSASFFAASL